MANNQINRSLEFANMQMAAEAFLLRSSDGGVLPAPSVLSERLIEGNNHSTKFMPVQADQFTSQYEVLAQYRNDSLLTGGTGFSGTLFRNRSNGELTLSFRSTEFMDDAARDTKATNQLELKDLGWGFGQIAEMEAWYAQLRNDPNLLAGRSFNVTGYSLGGHLATAFNILRREQYAASPEFNPVIATYTFNGAGVGGRLNNRRLTDLLADFNRIRANYAASPEWLNLPLIEKNTFLPAAQSRIDKIIAEQIRVAGLPGLKPSFEIPGPNGDQIQLGYQIAALLVARDTAGMNNFFEEGLFFLPTSPEFAAPSERFTNMTEIVGMESTPQFLASTYVSNSGVHYGYRQEVHIENQPLYRGSWPTMVIASLPNLIVANHEQNDLADTHSLVLLIDSLSLMAAMEKLAPALTIEVAAQIYAATTNTAALTAFGTQGKAEGDTLERMLDALRKVVLGPDIESTLDENQMRNVLNGNTWHAALYRTAFHDRLKELRDYINALVAGPNVTFTIDPLETTDAAQLAALAQGSVAFAYRYALKELNPFAVVGELANSIFYDQHNINGALDFYDANARTGELTPEWITDRAAFQFWKKRANINNATTQQSLPGSETVRFIDLPQKYNLPVVPVGVGAPIDALTRRFVFGGENADAVVGGPKSDRLYGSGGTDYLIGRADIDHLEGGTGLDVYEYNAYSGLGLGGTDGDDVIRDIDGRGVLRYVWHDNPAPVSTVIADASQKLSDSEWSSANGKFTYLKAGTDLAITINDDVGGGFTLKDFRDGDFGIYLRDVRSNPQNPIRTFFGDKENYDTDPMEDGIQPDLDGFGNYLRADGQGGRPDIALSNRADVFYGSTAAGEVEKFQLGGGNDQAFADGLQLIPAAGGVAWLQGGDGRDQLHGGAADDLIEAGANGDFNGEIGGDIAYGGLGKDELYAETKISIAASILLGESGDGTGAKGEFLSGGPDDDWTVGSPSNDYLDGGGGKDLLIGGRGDDNITGDYGYVAGTPAWVVIREIGSQSGGESYFLSFPIGVVTTDAGPADADVIYAGAGADWIFANGGDDYVNAGAGNDIAFGDGGSDIIIGESGDDLISGDNPGSVFGIGEGGDFLDGGEGNDRLYGNGGDDILFGGTGDDELNGGDGRDILIGGPGTDALAGGAGKDTYVFNRGDGTETIFDADADSNSPDASVLVLGDGVLRDEIKFGVGSLAVDIGNGDRIHFSGFDQVDPTATTPLAEIQLADGTSVSYADILGQGFDIDGTEGNDNSLPNEFPNLVGTGVTDRIRGLGGNDVLFGLVGDDMLDGGEGSDSLVGGAGADTMYGGAGADAIWGAGDNGGVVAADGADLIYGGDGDDYVEGSDGADQIFGENGIDTLHGQAGGDVIDGEEDDDTLYGDGLYFFIDDFYLNLFDDGAADTLRGGGGNDYLNAAGGDDTLEGGAGNDQLLAESGNDTLSGDAGDDALMGGVGDDSLAGGPGRDSLQGQEGNDTYLFDAGDGEDTLADQSDATLDVLRFGSDIAVSDISFARGPSNSLVAWHLNGTDQVTIQDWYSGSANKLDYFEFADTTQISPAQAEAIAATFWRGGSGNDSLGGGSSADTLYGLGGDDSLFGDLGSDILIGGTGNDYLSGGGNADTYRISLGDGGDYIQESDQFANNTLMFEANVASTDISFERIGTDLVTRHVNGVDSVTVGNWFAPSNWYRIETVTFAADGLTYTRNQIGTAATVIPHQYTLDLGDGAKLIEDWGGVDTLAFGAGIAKADIHVSRVSLDLTLAHTNGTDHVTIKDWFNDIAKQIENVEFAATGEFFTQAELTDPFLTMNGTAGSDVLEGGDPYSETINGLGGNDVIRGRDGWDLLTGGQGDDALYGGAGIDRYFFSSGDGIDVITEDGGEGGVLQLAPGLLDVINVGLISNGRRVTFTGSSDSIELIQTGFGQILIKGELNGTSAPNTLTGNNTFGDVIQGLGGNDSIQGRGGPDEIYGGPGNDIIEGGDDVDQLWGNEGDDVIDGGLANASNSYADYFWGGPGNDTLYGGSQQDRYYYARGDGLDLIIDEPALIGGFWYFSQFDQLVFGAGIGVESLAVAPSGNDLQITLSPTERITLRNWMSDINYRVDEFVLDDGSTLDSNEILLLAYTQRGTSGNDTLTGTANNDALYGLGGNDTLSGSSGHDLLDGGTGNDTLDGGTGDDRYLFGVGGGQDRIVDGQGNDRVEFAAGVSAGQIAIGRSLNSLVLGIAGTADTLTVENALINSAARVETFVFTDASTLPDVTTIVNSLVNVTGTSADDVLQGTSGFDVLYGYDGNDTLNALGDADTLYGGAHDDILNGGPGNDTLQGEAGNDTYNYLAGDGVDVINDSSGADIVAFGAGIATAAVTPTRSTANLVLNVNVAGNAGTVTVQNYFNAQETELIQFSDGANWDVAYVRSRVLSASITSGNDLIYGYETDDTINSLAGNDTVYGSAGNDSINGATGSDTLYGESGDDTLSAGTGESKNASIFNTLYGGDGNDVLVSSGKTDSLWGESGNDISLGAAGIDSLRDAAGSNMLFGAAGADTLGMGDGNDLSIGGTGNEAIDGDFNANGTRGRDIVAFNKSDGIDSISRLGAASTISIGGGTLYSNLSFAFSGTNLLLKTSNSNYVSLVNWYGSPAEKTVSTLQIVIEGTSNYNANSSNALNNRKIQTFDFLGLVAAYDAAGRPNNFSIANNLAARRIGGSDTEAIGGALAYQYARTGTLGTLTHTQMQAVVNDPAFAQAAQSIAPPAALLAEGPAFSETGTAFTAAALVEATATSDADPDVTQAPEPRSAPTPEFAASEIAQRASAASISESSVAQDTEASAPTPPPRAQGNEFSVAGQVAAPTPVAAGDPRQDNSLGAQSVTQPGADTNEALVMQWFERSSQNDDLTLLDDILRGDDRPAQLQPHTIAAAWEHAHHWLNHFAGTRNGAHEADADSADLSGLSYFGLDANRYDLPRAPVGLGGVAGHEIKVFKGLQA